MGLLKKKGRVFSCAVAAALLSGYIALCAGCGKAEIKKECLNVKSDSGKDYEVVKLFEVDGVSVYRFHDAKTSYVYFTNRSGLVESRTTQFNGKVVNGKRVQTICE